MVLMNDQFIRNMLQHTRGVTIEKQDVRYLEALLLDELGRLKPVPASLLSQIPRLDLIYFCNVHGFYSIPSVELIDLLMGSIPNIEKTIEIGAGNGVYGRCMNIKMTDNYQQHPKNRNKFNNCIAAYERIGAALVPYGDDVEERDARDAVSYYKPKTVIGAWVTQKYNMRRPHMKGNMFGVPYQWIYNRKHVEQIILIGNKNVHGNVEIMRHPHEEIQCDDLLFSRAIDSGNDRIFIWNK